MRYLQTAAEISVTKSKKFMLMPLFESERIEAIHSQLNAKGLVPCRGFRRNVVVYELVCYVNNIIACYVSKNEEPIPIFIERSRLFIANAKSDSEWQAYYNSVSAYLNELESHLNENGIILNS